MKRDAKKFGIVFIAIMVALVAIVVTVTNYKQKINTANLDPETSRAMRYEEVTDDRAYYVDESGELTEPCDYVKFSAFFPKDIDGDGQVNKLLGSCNHLKKTAQMMIELKIDQEGTLKNGVISFNGTNSKLKMSELKGAVLKDNCVFEGATSKNIVLNDIDAGTYIDISGYLDSNVMNEESYSKSNSWILTGTYVDGEGNETPIRKEVDFIMDWYGTAKARFGAVSNSISYSKYTGGNGTIEFEFYIQEIAEELIPDYVEATLEIPMLAGEYPLSVEANNSTYDEENHILTIKQDTASRSTKLTVKLNYSDTVYETVSNTNQEFNGYTLVIPVTAHYACYNNPNEEFDNPYVSEDVQSNVTVNFYVDYEHGGNDGGQFVYDVKFPDAQEEINPSTNKKIETLSKDKLLTAYDGTEDGVDNYVYKVDWNVNYYGFKAINLSMDEIEWNGITWVREDGEFKSVPTGIRMLDYGDSIDGNYMNEYVSVKAIYFENMNFLTAGDYVYLYNQDTNELIKTFSYTEVNTQYISEGSSYKLPEDVKHIKIETNEKRWGSTNSELKVVQIKEFDTEKIKADYTRAQIEDMSEIKTQCNGSFVDGTHSVNGGYTCKFVSQKNSANLLLDQTVLSVSEPVDELIQIQIPSESNLYSAWQNGIFLIKVPSVIYSMKINSVSSGAVNIDGYELYKRGNTYFIKIVTSNDVPKSAFNIFVNATMTVDPRAVSGYESFSLYYYNEYNNSYMSGISDYYDINNNGNTKDTIGIANKWITISVPQSFISSETLTNYDDDESITIAPNIADIEIGSTNSATVNLQIINNFQGLIGNGYDQIVDGVRNIVILGKIPFKDNSYISGSSLGSDFTATMKDGGITVPYELKKYAKVYYSTNENPTKDVSDESNGWTLGSEVESFEEVRSYLIVLENYYMDNGLGYEFSYDINIPSNVNINSDTYSCHIVYFDLVIDNANLSSSVQPSKLGIRMTDYFDLNLTKVKENTELPVSGAVYQLSEVVSEDAEETYIPEQKIETSSTDGSILFENFRINQEYELREIRAPGNYELSDKVIRFMLKQDENGNRQLQVLSEDGFNSEISIEGSSEGKIEARAIVADVPKIKLIVKKLDEDTNEPIQAIGFEIAGQTYLTNSRGTLEAKGFSFGKEYTMKETIATGYYKNEQEINFTVNKDENNNITISSNSENFVNAQIRNEEDSDLVEIEVTFTNKKVPTYNFKLVKVDESNTETTLEGARFLFSGEDDDTRRFYTTDENGEIAVGNLYEYVPEKSFSGKYTLQETEAPDGYINNQEVIEFVVSKNDNDEYTVSVTNEDTLETFESAEFNEDTLTITIKDKSMFKVTKIDNETREPLKNVEFVIYELNSDGTILDYAKDSNGNYIGKLDSDGKYVVTTDENGTIIAPLRNGTYKLIETKELEGYAVNSTAEIFTISSSGVQFKAPDIPEPDTSFSYKEIKIYTIEDLMDFAKLVNEGRAGTNKKVYLMNDLDFDEDSSYEIPDRTDYGDLNGDGTTEGLKAELTNTEKPGWQPIGNYHEYLRIDKAFVGTFDGQGHTIKNLKMVREDSNDSASAYQILALFGNATSNTVIKNLGVTGNLYAEGYGAKMCGISYGGKIYNCWSGVNINYDGRCGNAYGIGGTYVENCYYKGNMVINNTETWTYSYSSINGIGNANNSYCIGNIKYTTAGASVNFSPISGNNSYYLDSASYSTITSSSNVGEPKSSEYMKSDEFVQVLGTDNWAKDEDGINDGYPILKLYQEPESTEEEVEERTVEIKYIDDLVALSESVKSGDDYKGATVKLMNDLDFENPESYNPESSEEEINAKIIELTSEEEEGFEGIGDYSNVFSGIFDGQGYKIENLHMNRPNTSYIGLFNTVHNATIKNLTLYGSVKGQYEVGGICGYAVGNLLMENCNNYCDVEGYEFVAGILALHTCENLNESVVIKNCKNYGTISDGGNYGYVARNCW